MAGRLREKVTVVRSYSESKQAGCIGHPKVPNRGLARTRLALEIAKFYS